MKLEDIAKSFVDLLVPEKFAHAEKMLSDNCVYVYGDEFLTGNAIIKSFEDNHINAAKKLDSIEYIEGSIDSVNGEKVTIIVKDKIVQANKEHLYTDRLIISVKNSQVVKIEYQPFPEERAKLKSFLKQVKVEL